MAEVQGIKTMEAVEAKLAVSSSRGAAVGKRRRRVPPARGAVKRMMFALIYKKLKLATEYILPNSLPVINCSSKYS